jgi:hypothetical protein
MPIAHLEPTRAREIVAHDVATLCATTLCATTGVERSNEPTVGIGRTTEHPQAPATEKGDYASRVDKALASSAGPFAWRDPNPTVGLGLRSFPLSVVVSGC